MLREAALLSGGFWSAATIGTYGLCRRLDRARPRFWTSPLLLAPVVLLGAAWGLGESYRDYLQGTGWLLAMLGPATVAFALPIYEHRALIRRHGLLLALGVVVGSATSMFCAFFMANGLGLSVSMRQSLLPRSITTPFAMNVSCHIGGKPELTAVFVVLTGVFGAAAGEALLGWLPLRTSLARGALLGMGAHGAGVAKAHQVGAEEASMAGLVMVLAGLMNVLLAPLVSHWF